MAINRATTSMYLIILCFASTVSFADSSSVVQIPGGSLQIIEPAPDGETQIMTVTPSGDLSDVMSLNSSGEVSSPTNPDQTPGAVPQIVLDSDGNLTNVTNVNPDGTVSSSVSW